MRLTAPVAQPSLEPRFLPPRAIERPERTSGELLAPHVVSPKRRPPRAYIAPRRVWSEFPLSRGYPTNYWYENNWHADGHAMAAIAPASSLPWGPGGTECWAGMVSSLGDQPRCLSFGPYAPLDGVSIDAVFCLGFDQCNNDRQPVCVLELCTARMSTGAMTKVAELPIFADHRSWQIGPNGLKLGIFTLSGPGGPNFNARVRYTGQANLYHFQTFLF